MTVVVLTPGAGQDAAVTDALMRTGDIPGWGTDVHATLDWCVAVGRRAPTVGGGRTRLLWELLAAVAARDVSAARMLEPHLDALSILHEAGADELAGEDSRWGVFAAEASGVRLTATPSRDGWVLNGTKPWCSLAADLSHALVTAFVDDEHRRLFAVDLRVPGVHPHEGEWFASGLPNVVSSPVDFAEVPAVPVGEAGWYLTRRGFARGGMSVAACWWGAAAGLSEALVAPAASDRADQLALVHLGRVDAALWAARAALAEAADLIDGAGEGDERLLAERVRTAVADAATLTLAETDAALGPAPLVMNRDHARRVADLHLYLRQHHGLRDVARIGRARAAASPAIPAGAS